MGKSTSRHPGDKKADTEEKEPDSAKGRSHFDAEDFFGTQRTSTADLPDPRKLVSDLGCAVVEVLAGARNLDQLARWVSDDVYRHLLKRVVIASRARRARSVPAQRPSLILGRPRLCEPADGVVEAVVTVSQHARTRAIAIRLEGMDGRWRASAIHVL